MLALAFPDEVEALASPTARSLASSPQGRWAATRFLGFLADAGHPGAKRTLADLVEDPSPHIAEAALCMLGASDLEGDYASLYFRLALRGNVRGAIFLSHHPDSLADALSRAAGLLPSARFPAPAHITQEYRRRLAYLGNGSYFEAVNAAFAEEEPSDYDRVPWLIEFGRRHFPAQLRAALRVRLDRDFAAFEKSGGSYSGYEMGNQNPSETFHDTLLVALWELGGRPHRHEARRLEKYGYGCDPRKRLYEILREGPFEIY